MALRWASEEIGTALGQLKPVGVFGRYAPSGMLRGENLVFGGGGGGGGGEYGSSGMPGRRGVFINGGISFLWGLTRGGASAALLAARYFSIRCS